jgi:peptide/nickel transport system permease protein
MTDISISNQRTGEARRRHSHGRSAVIAFAVPLLLIALLCVCASLLPIPDPTKQNLGNALLPPSWLAGGSVEHILGTDHLGRDLLARILYGGRLTFLVSICAMLAAAIPGTLLGLFSGYYRGWADTAISRLVEAQLALPFILLAIVIIAARGRSLPVLIGVLALIGWAQYARVIRAETLSLRERPFILGLRCAGLSKLRILLAHLLPNVVGTALVLATLQMGSVILAKRVELFGIRGGSSRYKLGWNAG